MSKPTVSLTNWRTVALELNLEPSAESFPFASGAKIEAVAAGGDTLEVHVHDDQVVLTGRVQTLVQDGKKLVTRPADPVEGGGGAAVASLRELQAFFEASGRRAMNQGADAVMVTVPTPSGRSRPIRFVWSADPGMVALHAGLAIRVASERETALALAVSRANFEVAFPGFRIMPATENQPNIGVTYTIAMPLDERGAISTRALEMAVNNAVEAVTRLEPVLEKAGK